MSSEDRQEGRRFYGNQHTLDEELAYDYDDMVQHTRSLAQEIGRPPTTRDAQRDQRFPSIRKIYRILGKNSWNDLLSDADAGETQVGTYGPDERPNILADIRRVYERTEANRLPIRAYQKHAKYNKSVVKRLFGTWVNACNAAGLSPGSKHGNRCRGPNGEILESRHELDVARALDGKGLAYDAHRSIPNTQWRCDFYVDELELWIEVDGYRGNQRPNRASFLEKLEHYEETDRVYVIVSDTSELEKKVFQRL